MSKNPRICFVSMEVYPNLRPGVAEEAGGAGFQLVQLARGLRDRGYQVSFVVGDYGQEFVEEIDGFQVFRANRVAYDRSIKRGLTNLWRLFKAMKAAKSQHYVLRSTRFLSFFVMLNAKLLNAKYTFMVANLPHCLREELESLSPVFRRLYESSLNHAARVTVQSEEQQSLLLENFRIKAPIVPNGIEVPQLEEPTEQPEYDFVWVASFKVQKRADHLIAIAKLLPNRKFLVVGGPGPNKAYSQGLIEQLKQLPNVTFAGFVNPDKVGQVYRQARLFLNTSDWEGFPNGFLYAWSRGIPACSLHINPDNALIEGGLGLVDESVDTLAAKMNELLDDPARYTEMARLCYQHVKRAHSLERSVDVFLTVLP
ncbi:MAG: glycosyltransferase involved in cell wall biosynthesis [Candidatus Krumholzibacteriia bacterium]|jgi:glycosyltransferase involved in cell wall biosynthesis